ncbi:cation:proton antiporter regulatory subunit [Haloarcula argentinensis]|uniref:Potassium transporter TrkA n=1 Tax=Haloarcula argentinensis TaxID=43776 RepID=A0A847UQ16_HALAR|nr:cation:proton antiporter regulatory subunit [Haloarcula argentinensis]NLV14280.1 potassium transporter TrkA [Haloarcula argentinensis]
MDVTETDLPGVGKKHEVNLGGGQQLVVVTHNTGTRELYLKEDEDADSEKLLELSDRMARMVGTILEGAYFQPVESSHVETMLSEGTLLEWYAVKSGSPLVGETLAGANVGQRTGVTVVAIQRDDDVISGPTSTVEIEAGDTVVVIGERDNCESFEKLLAGNL